MSGVERGKDCLPRREPYAMAIVLIPPITAEALQQFAEPILPEFRET